jgi:hypothetical protein
MQLRSVPRDIISEGRTVLMAILSIDLAYKSYDDIGAVVLEKSQRYISCETLDLRRDVAPTPAKLAETLSEFCEQKKIRILLLDGPQGWKAKNNDLPHSRHCEKELNTPAKTGEPFVVKPAPYGPFVRFSIAVYDALGLYGWERLSNIPPPTSTRLLIESFPKSAWEILGIPHLPAKRKMRDVDMAAWIVALRRLFSLQLPPSLTHDQLQALVSGFAGLAIECGQWQAYTVAGAPPLIEQDLWREGFIVNCLRPNAHIKW